MAKNPSRISSTNLQSDRLNLRSVTMNDLQNVFKGLSNSEVVKYYGVNYDNLESTKNQLIWFEELQNQGTGIWWAICSAESDVFYGAIGFNNLSLKHQKIELGFWLPPEFWGKGIVT